MQGNLYQSCIKSRKAGSRIQHNLSELAIRKVCIQPSPITLQEAMNILDRLPRELQVEVYKQLDGHSLRSMLWGLPERISDFIVVSDSPPERDIAVKFFNVPGIKIVRLSEYHPSMRYNRHIFTLYELSNTSGTGVDLFGPIRWPRNIPFLNRDLPYIDKRCFVYTRFYFCGLSIGKSVEKLIQLKITNTLIDQVCVDILTRPPYTCLKVCGFPYWPTNSHTVGSFYDVYRTRLADLRLLEVYGVTALEDLTFRYLRSLTAHFGRTPSGCCNSIVNIKAPRLETLVVYYEDDVPIIKRLRISELGPAKDPDWPKKSFKIIHKPPLPAHFCAEFPNSKLPEKEEDLDLSFTTKSVNIHVVGGPNELLKRLSFTNCAYFYWKQADPRRSDDFIGEAFDLGNTSELTFETTLPRPRLPKFTFNKNPKTLALLWYDPVLDFNRFWERTDISEVVELGLWCYDTRDGDCHTVVPASVLQALADIRFLDLRGVELGRKRLEVRFPNSRFGFRLDMGRMKGPFAELDNAGAWMPVPEE